MQKNNPTVSVCIMTLGRDSLYQTIQSILKQRIDVIYEIVIVLQGTVNEAQISEMNNGNVPLKIYKYPHNLGFGYYRNRCFNHAKGDIIVWIDDDEWAMNDEWLFYIVQNIRNRSAQVVTAGCHIPLGQGYLNDCISLIGYPGGGALGFSKVWRVNKDGTTKHLCGGNFAIHRSLLEKINLFEEKCVFSCDDTHLAGKISAIGELIYYEPCSTLFHSIRTKSQLSDWVKNRKKGIYDYNTIKNNDNLFIDKVLHLFNLLSYCLVHPYYIPGMIIIIFHIIFL